MVTYPVHVPRKGYSGGKAAIRQKVVMRNRIAAELERHINEKIAEREEETQVYLYYEIARDTGYDVETVKDILFGVDCGHNGFTVSKSK